MSSPQGTYERTSPAARSAPRIGARALWHLTNAPHAVESGSMRLGCAVFFVVYVAIVIFRSDSSHGEFVWLRTAVCLYALLGIRLARRPTWCRVRGYTVGLAFLLPLETGYIGGILGNHVAEVALSALATFAPLVFLQAGWDFVVVDLGLIAGHALLLSMAPVPAVPIPAVWIMLGGAITTGTVAGLQTLIYRSRWAQSVAHLEQAFAASAEWQNRYEAASLASGQLLYDWDPRTNEVSYGGAYERILGYSLEELSGGLARWRDLVHPDDLDAFDAEIRRTVNAKEPFHLQYRVRRKDGHYLVVEDSGYFVFDGNGNILRLVGFASDVTERTNAEAFRAEEAAVSAALAYVGRELISSLERPVLLERLCRLTTEVLGCDFSQTWLWHPEEQVYSPISAAGMTTEEWESLRILRMPSGPTMPLMSRLLDDELVQVPAASAEYTVVGGLLAHHGLSMALCAPLRRGGEMIGVQSAGYRTRTMPFTPAQQRIARGIAQLASMALTNVQLVEELEHASRLKTEFVSTMSHELRTPLNVILGYSDMIADLGLGSEQARLLTRLRHSSVELLELIEATLDLNRIAAGKDVPNLEPVALAGLWDELETEFAALPPKAGVELRWEGDGAAEFRTDRRRLKMILKNLVGNARKFTAAGSVTVRYAPAPGRWVFTIADTGIGIPRDHLPHIFDMFRQVDSSDARSYGGVGLGLYIVRQLVDQLGGEVHVESEPGQGSTFRVILPAAADTHSAAAVA